MKRLLLTLTGVSAMMTLFAQDLSVRYGKGYTLKSTADAPAIGATSYTWYEDGEPLLDSNSASYTIGAETRAPGTYAYWRVAANEDCPEGVPSNTFTVRVEATGTNQEQGGCTYTETAPVSTFANFVPGDYTSSTFLSLTDERDGKVYPVVKIANRWIMARNLNYQGTTGNPSSALTWKANSNEPNTNNPCTDCIGVFWCPGGVNNNSVTTSTLTSCDAWGALYTWETAMMVDGKWSNDNRNNTDWGSDPAASTNSSAGITNNGCRGAGNENGHGICPPNWHVPTDGEWGDLLNAMDDNKNHNSNTGYKGSVAGIKSRSKCKCASGFCHTDEIVSWYSGGDTGSDSYGFRMLPSGQREYDGSNFYGRGYVAYFYSSSAYSATSAWTRTFGYELATVSRYYHTRSSGFSVRCIRDSD